MKTFELGDIVKLKSGGPDMTVHDYVHKGMPSDKEYHDDKVECIWFDDKCNLHTEIFNNISIVKV